MARGESRVVYEAFKADPSNADWGVAPLKWEWQQNDLTVSISARDNSDNGNSSSTFSDHSSPAAVDGNDAMDTDDSLLMHGDISHSGDAAAVPTTAGKLHTVYTAACSQLIFVE
jgi:hypothetical protein